MIAIVRMRMSMNPAGAVIQQVGRYNKGDCRYQEPGFIPDKKLFQHQEGEARKKKREG